jgi:hypothetical protein
MACRDLRKIIATVSSHGIDDEALLLTLEA